MIRSLATVSTTALVLALLTGCGSDATDPSDTAASPAAGSFTPDGDGEVVDELGDALGDGEGVEEAIDSLGEDGLNDTLGKSLVTVLSAASAYELDGTRLIVSMSGDPSDSGGMCAIANASRDGVGATADITLRYPGEDVDCSA